MGKVDRRVERTRQLLRGAMRSLLDEADFEAITVQQIIDRANVGRATFYAHFDSKDDLFASGFDELRAALKTRQGEALSGANRFETRVFAFSQELFGHADEYRAVFRGMAGKQSGATVERLLHKLLLDLVRDDVRTVLRDRRATEALARFVAGGMFGLLIWWLNETEPLTVTDIDVQFRNFAIPALKAARVQFG